MPVEKTSPYLLEASTYETAGLTKSINTRESTTNESVQHLENALIMLEDKIMRLGVGYQEHYAISTSIGLLKANASTNARGEEIEAADRVAKLMGKVLSLEDNYTAAATLASLPNLVGAVRYRDSVDY